jgi:hypothetical protein
MSSPKSPTTPRRRRTDPGKGPGKQSAPPTTPDQKLHRLQNTLASLKLRLAVLAADPTCRWAQEENLSALQRITDQAMSETHEVRELLDRRRPAPRPRRRRG